MTTEQPAPVFVPVEFALHSDVGRVRARNEDVVQVRPDRGWAVLADGMGGYRGGDVAAQLAVAATLARLEYEAAATESDMASVEAVTRGLVSATQDANLEILRAGVERPDLAGMGSTLLATVFLDGRVVSAHVGDSRLYRWRGGDLEQLTHDHTMLQEQVDGGMMTREQARRSRFRGMLTRGLGVAAVAEPELGVHAAGAGDIFLLCSDGLTDMVDDEDIAEVLGEARPLGELAERLIECANAGGGRDNVSVIIARIPV